MTSEFLICYRISSASSQTVSGDLTVTGTVYGRFGWYPVHGITGWSPSKHSTSSERETPSNVNGSVIDVSIIGMVVLVLVRLLSILTNRPIHHSVTLRSIDNNS